MADTGAVSDLVFLGLLHVFGASTFILFGAISAAGGVYVYKNVPETKGKNLQEVQALMKALHPDAGMMHCQCILFSEINTFCQLIPSAHGKLGLCTVLPASQTRMCSRVLLRPSTLRCLHIETSSAAYLRCLVWKTQLCFCEYCSLCGLRSVRIVCLHGRNAEMWWG
jgi:hypothetical protein